MSFFWGGFYLRSPPGGCGQIVKTEAVYAAVVGILAESEAPCLLSGSGASGTTEANNPNLFDMKKILSEGLFSPPPTVSVTAQQRLARDPQPQINLQPPKPSKQN